MSYGTPFYVYLAPLPSLIIPLIIGIYCFVKYRKDTIGIVLGLLSMIIGIVTFILNMQIVYQNQVFFFETGYYKKVLFITIMADVVLIPSLIIGTSYIRKIRASNSKWKPLSALFSTFLIVIIVITILGNNYIAVNRIWHTYTYSITINPNGTGDYYLLVPAPLEYNRSDGNGTVISDFKIINGAGNISVIETAHGKALNISSNGQIELIVEGKSDYGFHDVTLKNASSYRSFFIYCNKTFTNEIMISIYGHDTSDYGGFELLLELTESIKEDGWSDVKGKYEVVVV